MFHGIGHWLDSVTRQRILFDDKHRNYHAEIMMHAWPKEAIKAISIIYVAVSAVKGTLVIFGLAKVLKLIILIAMIAPF